MVDASAMDLPVDPEAMQPPPAGASRIECAVLPFDASAAARYARFAAQYGCAPHQSALFMQAWQEATGADIVVATLSARGTDLAMLPLEIHSSAICRSVASASA